jgi:hypothetical protein
MAARHRRNPAAPSPVVDLREVTSVDNNAFGRLIFNTRLHALIKARAAWPSHSAALWKP